MSIGNTRAMTSIPNPTRYHRWLGWHAPAMRRTVIVGSIGLIVAVMLLWFVPWGMALVAGWDAAALAFLISVWPIIIRADGSHAAQLATREDQTRGSATVLLLAASVASLLGVGFALHPCGAGERPTSGAARRLRRADGGAVVDGRQHRLPAPLRPPSTTQHAAIRGSSSGATSRRIGCPTYGDFAYLAFTIGMCYQVSDTSLRDRRIRRTVLMHSMLSYVFGVVIVGGSVNLIAGLLR